MMMIDVSVSPLDCPGGITPLCATLQHAEVAQNTESLRGDCDDAPYQGIQRDQQSISSTMFWGPHDGEKVERAVADEHQGSKWVAAAYLQEVLEVKSITSSSVATMRYYTTAR